MRKFLMTAAVALSAMTMAVSAAQAKYTFALVPKNMNNPFFDQARDGCKKAEAESNGAFECMYIGPGEHGGGDEQVAIVQDLVAKKVDGIAVSPSNAPAVGRALRAASAAGIPTMTWDADLTPEDKQFRKTYIGTKNYDIGVNLAKIIAAKKPQGGKICLQSGGAAAANHNERLQGIRDTLGGLSGTTPPGTRLTGQNGWTEVDGCPLFTNDDSAVAVQQMADILNKYQDLSAYISTGAFTQWSDNAYRQAIQPHISRVKNGSLAVAMADTLPMQMQQLKDGLTNAQVGQRPYQMGQLAMEKLLDLKNGKTVPDPIFTGLDVCTQENAEGCLQK
jgi:ribose transport system substrate-binding protein